MKKYDGGVHDRPMLYGVRRGRLTANLVSFTGDGWKHTLGPRIAARTRPSVGDCAEAIWLMGAHPESQLLIWDGEDSKRGKVMMLGTAVLSVADGIQRKPEEQVPEYYGDRFDNRKVG